MVSFHSTGFANESNHEMTSECLQRVDKAEISKQEHDAIILSLLMEENANHIVLKFCQF